MVNMVVGYGAYALVYPNSEEFTQQVTNFFRNMLAWNHSGPTISPLNACYINPHLQHG